MAASAILMTPAMKIVPGSPTSLISQKPLASTPIDAPILFVKYSMAMLPPGVFGKRRMMPALISGNVIPKSTD